MKDDLIKRSADIRILGGLPVRIILTLSPPETERGETGPYVEDWEVVSRKNRPFGKWIYDRIEERKETEKVIEDAYKVIMQNWGNN